MTDLTIDDFKSALVADVADNLGFRDQRQFVAAWQSAGYPIYQPSARKRVVMLSDVSKFINERALPRTQPRKG